MASQRRSPADTGLPRRASACLCSRCSKRGTSQPSLCLPAMLLDHVSSHLLFIYHSSAYRVSYCRHINTCKEDSSVESVLVQIPTKVSLQATLWLHTASGSISRSSG